MCLDIFGFQLIWISVAALLSNLYLNIASSSFYLGAVGSPTDYSFNGILS